MANHKSAEKRIRQTARRTAVNRTNVTRIRTSIKKVESAVKSGNQKAAQEALKQAQPIIMKGVSKGVLKRNSASRKISRLAASIKALSSTA